ncbi:MAG: nucleoside deaminase [Rhizobiaceae bacterium]|nr:nucleoside deaminase [Rhizobiaceae bacterium]
MTRFMDAAIDEAKAAALRNEVPVGAALVKNGKIIAKDGNRTLEHKDPTAHAEILVIRTAALALGSERLSDCDLYVTLEPCAMCAAAISFSRISNLYFGASDIKSGGVENGVRFFNDASCHHAPQVYGGLQAETSGMLLKTFFEKRR